MSDGLTVSLVAVRSTRLPKRQALTKFDETVGAHASEINNRERCLPDALENLRVHPCICVLHRTHLARLVTAAPNDRIDRFAEVPFHVWKIREVPIEHSHVENRRRRQRIKQFENGTDDLRSRAVTASRLHLREETARKLRRIEPDEPLRMSA